MAPPREPAPLRVGMLAYGLDRPASGIGRYLIELARALVAHRPAVEVVLLQPFAAPITALSDLYGRERVALVRGGGRLPAMMAVGPFALAVAAGRWRLDVVHDPVGIGPFLPRLGGIGGRFGRVMTLHDAIPFVYPETHPWLTNALFRRYIPRTLPFVDRVITVSDAAKRDLARFYGLPSSKLTRIHNGIGDRFRPVPEREIAAVLPRYGIDRPYLLTVGALQARKNLESVFGAFAALRASGLPHRLAVVGSKAWKTEGLFRRLDELDLGDAVTSTGYVADEDLPALYAGADCFLFPSLYEGFGFPPLEAMACGTPAVVADASSLPEVVGDAALLVPPRDVVGIAAAVRRVLEEPDLAETLRARGMARAGRFTWERAAVEHVALYREVAGGRPTDGRRRGSPPP